MIHLLSKRLEAPEWMIVLKALIVFHRLLRDGKEHFINELKYKSSIFASLQNYTDQITAEAHHQSVFVRKYARFLEEKVVVFKIAKMEFERDPAALRKLETDELLEKLPRLQSLLNALLNTKASKDHINNQIIVSSFQLLLKDSFRLYRALNEGIIVLLEQYFSMDKDHAQKAFEIYKLFVRETDSTISFFDICERFTRTKLPELQHAPTTLISALENYYKDLEGGKSVAEAGKGGAAQRAKEAVVGQEARAKQAADSAAAEKTLDLLHHSDDENGENDDDDSEDSDADDELTGAAVRNPFDPFATDERTQGASASVAGTASKDPFDDDAGALPMFEREDPFGPSLAAQSSHGHGHGHGDSKKADIMSLFSQPQPQSQPSGGPASSSSASLFGFQSPASGANSGGFGGDYGQQSDPFGGGTGGFGSNGGGGGFGSSPGFGSNAGYGNGNTNNTGSFGQTQPRQPVSGGFSSGGFGGGQSSTQQSGDSPFDGLVDFGKPKKSDEPTTRDKTPMGAMTGGASSSSSGAAQDNPFGASPSASGGATFNPFG
jgi:ANTH domain